MQRHLHCLRYGVPSTRLPFTFLGVKVPTPKKVKGKRVDGTPYLKQYRWRCTFRDAYYVCCLIWPFAHTKLPKIQRVIEHYTQQALKSNVISLDEYRMVQKDVR